MASLLLLHTCESVGTAEANAEYLVRIGAQPHWVFDPRFGVDEAIQLVPYTQSGKALRNLVGGVETNRREQDNAEGVDVIQVELVGYASEVGGYDDAWYRNLRAFITEICASCGIPYAFPRRFATSYGDDVRFAPSEWNDAELKGIVGHCHAPENDHWDPGPLDLARLAPESQHPEEIDVQLSDKTTNGHSVNDLLEWTIDGVNKANTSLAALAGVVADLAAHVNAPQAQAAVDAATVAKATADELAKRLTA